MKAFRILRRLLGFLALGGAAYAQYGIRVSPADSGATALFLLCAALAALAFGFEGETREKLPSFPDRSRTRAALAGILVALGFLALGTGAALLSLDWRRWFFAGWALYLAAALVSSSGLGLLDPPKTGERRWTRSEAFLLLGIFALGTWLRFHRYAEFPPPYSAHAVEEPQTGMGGYNILVFGTRPWEFFLDHWAAAAALAFAEKPNFTVLRVPFTIASALTILPLHVLLRQVVGTPAALAGTFFFAVSSWNVIYSRCAHNIFLPNLLVVTAFALALYFRRTYRLRAVPWLALLSGYTLYAYAGYRGTSLFVFLFLAGGALSDLRKLGLRAGRSILRRDLAALTVFLVFVLGVAAPLVPINRSNPAQPLYYFEAARRSLANREYYTSDPRAFVAQRVRRIRETAAIFLHRGDDSPTFNAPNEPMVDPVTGVFFVPGLFVALFFVRRRFHAFLLFLFVALLLGGAVFVQNLDVRRLQGVTPFVAALAALFLDRVDGALRSLPRSARSAAYLLFLPVAAFSLFWNYDVHFRKMARDPRVRAAFQNRYTVLVRYGHTEGAGREILLLSEVRNFFTPSDYWWLVRDHIPGRNLADVTELLAPGALRSRSGKPVSVVVQDPFERKAVAELLRAAYPGTVCREITDPDNAHLVLTACDLPSDLVAPRVEPRLRARYWVDGRGEGPPALERLEPMIAFAGTPPLCYSGPRPGESENCLAEWEGEIEVPEPSQFALALRAGRLLEAWADGERLWVRGRIFSLPAGRHRVVLRAEFPRGGENGAQLLRLRMPENEVVEFYGVAGPAFPGGLEGETEGAYHAARAHRPG
ncbi:MAG: hypothetical protein KatS3mg076_0504 [Candidatus Binatia bacterium]|nr:MAG: hypothetical protein KatS3mg076_0504 [Candidatus Binatia bacterium]